MTASEAHISRFFRISLRGRLTLWFLAMFMVIQLTLALVFLLYERESINEHFNERLLGRARGVAANVWERVPDVNDEALVRQGALAGDTPPLDALLVTLYEQGGGVIASTSRPALDASLLDLQGALSADAAIFERSTGAAVGEQFAPRAQATRTVLLPFRGADGKRYVLLAATRDLYAPGMMRLLRKVLFVLTPIGILAAALAGWLIAGIAVAPLLDVRQLVAQLAPESIGNQVRLEGRGIEIEQVERELEEARARLEQGYRAQERFLSNVSHELKTPISVLLTEAQTLRAQDASPELREFIDSVEEEMRKLGQLVNSFLLLTRVREGSDATASHVYPINELLMDCAEDCQPVAEQYDVPVEPRLLDTGAEAEAAVLGDPFLLRTMVNNLVRNALRFSPEDSVVRLAAEANDGSLRLSVRDYGPGIPREMLDHIFDRFVRAKSGAARGRGTGLGLEIAQGIAELHGGRIEARNCDDGGCEFTIYLRAAGAGRAEACPTGTA